MTANIGWCRFTNLLGGTVDFIHSGSAALFQGPATAGAVDGKSYRYYAESQDLSKWEIGTTVYTAATKTFARTTVLYNSLGTTAKISFSTGPSVTITPIPSDFNTEVPILAANTAAANSAILNAAISAAIGNVTLYLPQGNFLINAVTLKPGIALRGGGKHASRLLAGSNSIIMLGYTEASALSWNIAVRDIGFDTNGMTGVTAIRIDGGTSALRIGKVLIEHVEFDGAFTTGLYIKFCADSTITDVLASNCVNGFTFDSTADTDVTGCRAQNGTGIGFYVPGVAGAFDEGMRLTDCSTNGQTYGLWVNGQDWGMCSNCSFTTASGGALILTGANNWKFSSSEFAVGATPATANALVDSSCSDVVFTGNHFISGTFGITVAGTRCVLSGNTFKGNSNVDVYCTGTKNVLSNNVCDSTGNVSSITEAAPGNYNNIQGNVTNGTVNTVGANTVAANNIVY